VAIDTAEWLSTQQAAHRLNRSAALVRILTDRGTLRAVRTPLGRLIDPASVDELLQEREPTGSPADHIPA